MSQLLTRQQLCESQTDKVTSTAPGANSSPLFETRNLRGPRREFLPGPRQKLSPIRGPNFLRPKIQTPPVKNTNFPVLDTKSFRSKIQTSPVRDTNSPGRRCKFPRPKTQTLPVQDTNSPSPSHKLSSVHSRYILPRSEPRSEARQQGDR